MGNNYAREIAKRLLEMVPKVAKVPVAVVPFKLKAQAIERLLGLVLAEQTKDDELDFLSGNWVGIEVIDLDLTFEVSYQDGWYVRPLSAPQVTFSANSKELILVVAGKEDPDTLFFQRKLNIEGDTELGLEVKNVLLSIEFDSMPAPIRHGVEQLSKMIIKLQQQAEPEAA